MIGIRTTAMGFCSEREVMFNPKYDKKKWKFIAEELGVKSVDGLKFLRG